MPRHDAGEISRLLAGSIQQLCQELLPAGRKAGHEWVHPSLSGGSSRSLSVHLGGARAGVWADFASTERGDALDLVAAVRFASDRGAALRWARGWLGLGEGAPSGAASSPVPPTPPPRQPEDDAEAMARRSAALRMFLDAQPSLRGTPAAAYLAGRGIDFAELARQPAALRFHPSLWCSEASAKLPAMVAAISRPDRGHVATHRTWLAQTDGGRWVKAPLKAAKTVLGTYVGGTIRLWRGASGKPLVQAGEGETTVISEGIENGLSIALACPEYRVLAAVSVSNLGRILLPQACLDVIVAVDNDAPGSAAAAALQRAVQRLLAEGRSVRIARSSVGKDFNDALQSGAA